MNWINSFGLVIVILLLLPNVIFAMKNKVTENKCRNKFMNSIEQIGRYGCLFFMVVPIGLFEFAFPSKYEFILWLLTNSLLLLLYWLFWYRYFRYPKVTLPIILAIIPSAIFIIDGLLLRHWLLMISGILFSIGHIYVTYNNNRSSLKKM